MTDSPAENTSLYLLQKFIRSDRFQEFDLLPIDILILRTICDYLDMPLGKCFAKQTILAAQCLIKKQYFADRCLILVNKNLLFRYFKGKLYNYEMGSEITGIDQF